MRKKFLLTMFSLVLFAFCGTSLHAQNAVAKVDDTEYATIEEAIAHWSNKTTLTLLADVTLSDVIKLSSTEHHILDLGTYTMTAASGKDAIEILPKGVGTSAKECLTINADATNPGGITASGKSCIYYYNSEKIADRMTVTINGGVFSGSYAINQLTGPKNILGLVSSPLRGQGAAYCVINGGTFNAQVFLNAGMLKVTGGVFHKNLTCYGDQTAHRLISGGRFKSMTMTADASNKFAFGTAKETYNVGIYVDKEGYLVVGGPVITDLSAKYPAVASNYSIWSSYLKYSSAATYGLFYEDVDMAIKKHGEANVTVWVKPAVTIPEDVTGDATVVEEIKNNTALKDYTPDNLPTGAELEIKLKSVGETFVFDVTPMANGAEVEPTEAIIFRLPVPASVTKAFANVYHEGTLMGIYEIKGEGSAKYVEIASADFSEFAVEPTTNPAAKIGEVYYATFADALTAANAMNGDVTVEIYEKVTLNGALTGNYASIKFVGLAEAAEIYLDIQGYSEAAGKKVAFENLKLSKVAGGYITNAGFMNLAFGIYGATETTYTDCKFVNGAYASTGNVTFTGCTFYRSHDRYGLWAYGNVDITVDGCTFPDIRGIKMYAEGQGQEGAANLTVKNTDFTEADNKPAIVLTYGESVTLENNTYSSKGVFELDLDGKPNGVEVTSDVAPTCINDNGACGVLVDGKIYTTVAQAAEVATSGSTVTLLHNSTETVALPMGVTLNKNNFEAAGVTVAVPVAKIGDVEYATLAAAVEAAQAGDEIVVIANFADVTVDVTKNLTISGAATLNNVGINANGADALTVKGLTFTGNSWINSGTAESLTVSGVTATVAPSNASYTNSRSAFISLGRNEGQELALTLENNNITVTSSGPDAVLGWAKITTATITGNVIKGSSNGYFTNADAIKFMAIANGAEFVVNNNEIYSNYNGIVFAQNTTRDNAYSVYADANKFVGGADHIWIEVSGANTVHATVNATSANTVNGNAFTIDDIKYHSGVIKTWTSYAGVDVVTNENGKVIGGTLASYSNAESVAEGYEIGAGGVVGKMSVAKIGETKYETLEAAVAAVQAGDEITMLADATISANLTLPAGITFNGNGKAITGAEVWADGNLTFAGHTKVQMFNAGYNKPIITIGAGACLELTGTGRMVIGHGCTFNITGTIADAKTADKATLTPSLIMAGASFTGAGVTFNVTNAYIKATAYCSSKNSSANNTFNFNITNSIWDQTGSFVFTEPTSGKDPIFNLNLKDGVLNSTSHLVFAVTKGEIVFDNSNVNVGTSRQIENRSKLTIKNGSVVNGAVATSSNAKNPGTVIVENATYAVTGEFSGSDLGTGTLIIKKGATVSAGSITKANITIDAEGMTASDAINLTANLSKLAGTLSVINNDKLEAKIVDGKVVLVAKPVAKIGEQGYATLNEAFAAAAEDQTITLLVDATPALTSQRAITKAAVIDLGGKTLTLTEDDLYFGTTTFKNGTIVVDQSVKPSTAVFWMFANQTLTFDAVKVVATGVTGTYLIGLDGNNSDLNLINGSEILVENTTALDLDIICVNASTGNDIIVEKSKVNVTNLDGRVFFRGNYTVKDSEVNLAGITKAGFRIEAGQTLSIEGTSKVNIEGEPRDGGIHLTDLSATYTKAETATVTATVNRPAVAKIGETPYYTFAEAVAAANAGDEIVMLADATVEGTLALPGGIKLTSNGHTITGSIRMLGDLQLNGALTITGGLWVGKGGETLTAILSGDKLTASYFMFQHGTYTINADIDAVYGYLSYEGAFEVNSTIHTTGANGEVLYINGKVTLNDGAVLDSDNSVFVCNDNAVLTLKPGSKVDSNVNITKSGAKLNIDATGMDAGESANITGTVTNSGNGTIAVVGNDKLEAQIVNGKVVLAAKPVAKIGEQGYATITDAVAAVKEGETITILAGTHSEGTIKLPATLKNVTIKGAEGAILKDMKITSADGNSINYEGLKFDGITFDNSNIVLTGWRNNGAVYKNIAVNGCTFKNLSAANTEAAFHINCGATEAVNGFTFTNNVIDNLTGGSKSGIYAQVTGEVKVENNVINNVQFRPYVIQVTTDDGIADNFTVKGNTFSGSAVGRAQGLGNNAEGTDNVNLVVSNNIFKGITEAQQICYWNFNAEKTTADLSKNYYDIDILANPGKIYYNSAAVSAVDLVAKNIFPIYTELNEDGTINTESAYSLSGGTWGGIDWTLVDGTLTIAPTAGTPVPDKNAPTKRTYKVGEWRETVVYNKNGSASSIGGAPYDMKAVKKLIIKEGVTKIGSFTCQFPNLTGEVVIPSTVTYFGQEAFHKTPITKLTFAAGGTEPLCIANGVFKKTNIEEVSFPGDRPSIEIHHWAFGGSTKLKTAYIPANLTKVWGGEHVDYFDNFNSQTNPSWTNTGSIFTGCTAMETITFETEEIRDFFFAGNRQGTAEDPMVAAADLVAYNSLDKAIAAATDDIILCKNATLKDTWTIAAGKDMTLNLNGKTLSQSKACTASYEMINNKGNLNIVGSGKISFKDTGAGDPNFGWGSYTVRNEGNLVVEKATIEHLGTQAFGTHCIMAIYQYCGSTTINGGTISTPNYRSARLWKGEMTINGGTFDGQVWVQAVDNSANLTINGGTFEPNGGDASAVFVTNSDHDVQLAVANGTFNGKIGCSDAAKLAGAITGGTFSATAKENTAAALIATGLTFGEADANGYYTVQDDPSTHYINNVEELKAFRDTVNAGNNYAGITVYLAADIDLNNENWAPIGTSENPFNGMFDGQDHIISNLTINGSKEYVKGGNNDNYKGFFGYMKGGRTAGIKNLNIHNVKITGCLYVGSVLGRSYTGGVIENCHVKGLIQIDSYAYAGGVVGRHEYSADANSISINNCSVDGTVLVRSTENSFVKADYAVSYVGGIVGFLAEGDYKILDCSAKNIEVSGVYGVGGISGIGHYGNKFENASVDGVTVTSTNNDKESERTNNVGFIVGATQGTTAEPTIITGQTVTNTTATTTYTDGTTVNVDVLYGTSMTAATPVTNYVARIGANYYESFAEALTAAQAGETIKLINNVVIGDVTVAKSMTIDGNGYTVTPADANETYNSAFMVGDSGWGDDHGETITLKNIQFAGWKTKYGVVRAQGVTLAMDGCEFKGCSVSNAAYAVLSLNYTDATVVNSKFVENTSRAIDVNYNGDSSAAVVTIEGCTFDGNTTTGAGIVMRSAGKLALKNSTFVDNIVETNGNGATVYVGFGAGNEVSGCTFKNNTVITSHATTKRFASAIFCDGCVVNKNVFGEGNTATRNGEAISTIVAVGAYYGEADINANYWNGKMPVNGEYTIEYTRHDVAIVNYYNDEALQELKSMPSIMVTYKDGSVGYFNNVLDAVPYTTNYPKLEGATIKLLADVEGSGLRFMENDMVFDLNNHTYTITAGTGSQGTNTSGFQIRPEVTTSVVFKNGTINVADGAPVVWMFNCYATQFVVENVVVDCENMAWGYGSSCYVVVSRDGDDVQFLGTTEIKNFDAEVAGDAYNVGGTMKVDETASIPGTFTLSEGATLTAKEGLDVVAGEGLIVVYENGTYKAVAPVAKVGDKEFATVQDALQYAIYNSANEVKILGDVREKMETDFDLVINTDLTITAAAPVKVEFYNEGTIMDFAVGSTNDNTLTIAKNVHFDLTDRVIWLGYYGNNVDVVVEGYLGGYQIWHGADTKVTATGKLDSHGEAFIMRRNATLTVVDGEVNANYFHIYSGHINAENATITAGLVWIYNNHNYGSEGTVSMSLDNTSFTSNGVVTVYAGEGKQVPITLTNGTTFTAAGALTTGENVNITADATSDFIVKGKSIFVAETGDYKYASLAAAIEAAGEGATVTVISDINLTEGVTVAAGKVVTLDLAGYTISQTKEQTAGYQMILNDGTLTIEDSSVAKSGKISYTDSGNGGEYISDVIYNRATLVINGGTIENRSSATVATNGYPHAVDTYSGIRNTSVTINGGTIYCVEYSAVRMFCVSATYTADLTINGGTVRGAIDMQNGTKNAAQGSLTIKGGNFETTTNANNIRFANWNGGATEYGIVASVTGGNFNGGITTQYVPAAANFNAKFITGGTFTVNPQAFCAAGYTAKDNYDGTYTVKQTAGTLTRTLPEGWSWFSSYVDLAKCQDNEGNDNSLAVLENALGTAGVQIKDNAGQAYVNYSNGRWRGSLATVSSETMYAIKTSAEHTLEITGEFYDINEYEVSLRNGWNYLSYPHYEAMPVVNALGFTPANGDAIKGKGVSAFYVNNSWIGAFSLTPGEGYMYYSNEAGKEFSYSTEETRSSVKSYVSESSEYWTVDASQYPSNMTMIATLDVEGADYEVAAFVDGEVRGSARPIYVDFLDQYIVVMTINGENVANVTFKYYDLNAGEEYDFNNVVVYSNNAILGSIESPYALTRGTTGIDENSLNDINIYPNPTTTDREINLQATCDKVEVFNTLGVKVAEYQNVDSIDALETAGTYVIRLTLNGDVKHCRLVVK